jgi:DNA-binding XRE family transcriptional regulator
VRPPDFSRTRLPPDWLNAIREVEVRPPPDRVATGESARLDASGTYEHSSELRALVGLLKRERIARGLSLADVARRSQQARSAISRLENGQYGNPTLNTLYRYAWALGVHIKFATEPLPDRETTRDPAADPGTA